MSSEYVEYELPNGEIIELSSQLSDEQARTSIMSNFPELFETQAQPIDNVPRGSEMTGLYEKPTQNMLDVGPVMRGLNRFGAGIAQATYPMVDVALGTDWTERLKRGQAEEEQKFQEKYADVPGAQSLALASELAPGLIGGGSMQAARAPAFVSKALQNAPALVRGLGGGAGIFGKSAAIAGPYGAITYDPTFEQTGLQGALEKGAIAAPIGGLAGTAMAGLTRGLSSAASALPQLIPKTLRGLSPFEEPQARQMVQAVEGTATGLGDTIQSPSLKALQENVINKIPFSGASKSQIDTVRKINEEGINILDNLYPGNVTRQDAGALLKTRLIEADEAANILKREKYGRVDELADEYGVQITPDDYIKTAENIKNSISQTKGFGNLQSSEKNQLLKFLDEAISSEGGTLKGANLTRSDLRDLASQYKMKGSPFMEGAYNKLAKGLGNDIERNLAKPNIPPVVKTEFEAAQKYYKDEIVPFQDKEITKFTKKDADSDLLVNYFLRGGKTPRANLLEKLVTKLDSEDRAILAKSYLSDSIVTGDYGKNFDVRKMIRDYSNLNEKQQKLLFPEENLRNEFKHLSTLVKANSEPLTAMVNQPTGQRALDALIPLALGTGLIGGGGALAYYDKPMEAAGLLGATIGGGRLANRILTSPKMREQFLKGFAPWQQPTQYGGALPGAAGILGGQAKLRQDSEQE